MRLLWLFLVLAVLVMVPFLIWGESFGRFFEPEETEEWFSELGRSWAWLAGIGLLVSDLFLPIPGTVVMSALGYVYGPWLGGIFAAMGSMLAGIVAYALCRKMGRRAAEWIAGKEDLAKGEAIFGGSAGGWIVALSRWLPVMPEVIACLAGMARMPWRRFLVAMACGSVPLGFTFAAIGKWAHEHPGLGLLLSAGLPPLLWAIIGPHVMRRKSEAAAAGGD
jgi:uncharacterized membrane protein YdjX (TVP38/TMEM64 family)